MQNSVMLSYCKLLVACPISLEHRRNNGQILDILAKETPLNQMPFSREELGILKDEKSVDCIRSGVYLEDYSAIKIVNSKSDQSEFVELDVSHLKRIKNMKDQLLILMGSE